MTGARSNPTASRRALSRQLKKNIIGAFNAEVHFVRGFYNESLRPHLIQKLRMMPPLIVDLDCDLYVSSMPALRFLLDSKLLVPGVYLYMDDVSKAHWEARHEPTATHMAKAFAEITTEYGITWRHLMPSRAPLRLRKQGESEAAAKASQHRALQSWRPVLQMTTCSKCERA